MKTSFTPEQLADARTARSEQVIRACVHCGFCNATCPTYVLTGDELEGPRGRIYLMKEMLEGGGPATPAVTRHVDSCLSCLACMTTCPSGVHYMHLVDHARAHIEETYRRPAGQRMLRDLLARTLPYPGRFRRAVRAGRLARALKPLMPRALRPMLELLPDKVDTDAVAGVHRAEGERRGRVILLAGCVQQVVGQEINRATIRLLNRLGVEVAVPPEAGCCGALTLHLGREQLAKNAARRNINVWSKELDEGVDAIVINASGCGVAVKDYGHLFRTEPELAEKAARISALSRDVTEFVAGLGPVEPVIETGQTVAYHAACSLQHGLKVHGRAEELLRQAGFRVTAIPEGHLCCGSAGTYNLLQPETAAALRDRKLANIAQTEPDLIATGNVGCMTQLESGTGTPVVHTVSLLDWATGGPRPAQF